MKKPTYYMYAYEINIIDTIPMSLNPYYLGILAATGIHIDNNSIAIRISKQVFFYYTLFDFTVLYKNYILLKINITFNMR